MNLHMQICIKQMEMKCAQKVLHANMASALGYQILFVTSSRACEQVSRPT